MAATVPGVPAFGQWGYPIQRLASHGGAGEKTPRCIRTTSERVRVGAGAPLPAAPSFPGPPERPRDAPFIRTSHGPRSRPRPAPPRPAGPGPCRGRSAARGAGAGGGRGPRTPGPVPAGLAEVEDLVHRLAARAAGRHVRPLDDDVEVPAAPWCDSAM